ncbi:hypothetical protein ATCV1_z628L [Acanthocystis turfacea chlorella virus 1]|uniref:Uncharacterized protein z628L n=1 Tax=Chlorovirus heliozoae TaxID=322019 RepID=A7K9N8_9PHYC|nr:hypothetical protein ATCV1_z628L [Acanthocystis turfacea chlorella virus 1]ABT16762.1 hypothetical protein ATCV1_z628L [Acanthocystis turfacea chlorella virus 1]
MFFYEFKNGHHIYVYVRKYNYIYPLKYLSSISRISSSLSVPPAEKGVVACTPVSVSHAGLPASPGP